MRGPDDLNGDNQQSFDQKDALAQIWNYFYNENLVESEVILERGQRYLPTDVRLESSFLRSQVSNQYTLPKRLCNTFWKWETSPRRKEKSEYLY